LRDQVDKVIAEGIDPSQLEAFNKVKSHLDDVFDDFCDPWISVGHSIVKPIDKAVWQFVEKKKKQFNTETNGMRADVLKRLNELTREESALESMTKLKEHWEKLTVINNEEVDFRRYFCEWVHDLTKRQSLMSSDDIEQYIRDEIKCWDSLKDEVYLKCIEKGSNWKTDVYSSLKAEVEIDDDRTTWFNHLLMQDFKSFNRLIICGQASTHSVNYTVRDIVKQWNKKDRGRIYILTDGN